MKMEKVKYGYDIVATNNSYGSCPEACDFDPATYDAIAALVKPGVIMAFAAGQRRARQRHHGRTTPSNYDLPNIIAVAATDANDGLAGFSQYGLRSVDVGAPGVERAEHRTGRHVRRASPARRWPPRTWRGWPRCCTRSTPSLDWWADPQPDHRGRRPVASLKGKTVSGRRINANGSMTCSGQKVFGMLSPVANTGTMKQTVAALNINCAKPAGDVTVKITPGGTTLSLKDDGKGADLVPRTASTRPPGRRPVGPAPSPSRSPPGRRTR